MITRATPHAVDMPIRLKYIRRSLNGSPILLDILDIHEGSFVIRVVAPPELKGVAFHSLAEAARWLGSPSSQIPEKTLADFVILSNHWDLRYALCDRGLVPRRTPKGTLLASRAVMSAYPNIMSSPHAGGVADACCATPISRGSRPPPPGSEWENEFGDAMRNSREAVRDALVNVWRQGVEETRNPVEKVLDYPESPFGLFVIYSLCDAGAVSIMGMSSADQKLELEKRRAQWQAVRDGDRYAYHTTCANFFATVQLPRSVTGCDVLGAAKKWAQAVENRHRNTSDDGSVVTTAEGVSASLLERMTKIDSPQFPPLASCDAGCRRVIRVLKRKRAWSTPDRVHYLRAAIDEAASSCATVTWACAPTSNNMYIKINKKTHNDADVMRGGEGTAPSAAVRVPFPFSIAAGLCVLSMFSLLCYGSVLSVGSVSVPR